MKVGVAVHIPSLDISIAYRSSNKLSVFSAELEAVFTAISLVVKHNIANPLILSDSLNMINQFQNVPTVFAGNLMHVCRDLITQNNVNLSMCWIPGHSNIRDHDTADLLAKRALSNVAPRSLPRLGPRDFSDWIAHDTLQKWNNSSASHITGSVYHKIFPCGKPSLPPRLPRNKEVAISRLRLNNCLLNKYTHKIGLHHSGLCDSCKTPESVEHLITVCIKHKNLHRLLNGSALTLGHFPSVQLFLSAEPYISTVYDYIKTNSIQI